MFIGWLLGSNGNENGRFALSYRGQTSRTIIASVIFPGRLYIESGNGICIYRGWQVVLQITKMPVNMKKKRGGDE